MRYRLGFVYVVTTPRMTAQILDLLLVCVPWRMARAGSFSSTQYGTCRERGLREHQDFVFKWKFCRLVGNFKASFRKRRLYGLGPSSFSNGNANESSENENYRYVLISGYRTTTKHQIRSVQHKI